MPLPNLIHPINVTIARANKSASVYDDDAREPLRSVYRTTVVIPAQVTIRQVADPRFEAMGLSEEVRGYLLFRLADLMAASYTPARGDRVTKIGARDTALYLLQAADAGHYPDQNGATLMRFFFTDRRPSDVRPAT